MPASVLYTVVFSSHLLFNSTTADAADCVSHVKTVMTAPVIDQFGVGSMQVPLSEPQQLRGLSVAAYCSI